MVWPENALGIHLLLKLSRRSRYFTEFKKNERFMKKYYPERMELGPRDVVARAIYNEIAGRGEALSIKEFG
ncbi:MAG: hypothetical protein P0116_09355 [Candidatus Nitrosocosmicus sp.]|nr:hypothetical protein [Candidatus Nitrosocosmicus sp.]